MLGSAFLEVVNSEYLQCYHVINQVNCLIIVYLWERRSYYCQSCRTTSASAALFSLSPVAFLPGSLFAFPINQIPRKSAPTALVNEFHRLKHSRSVPWEHWIPIYLQVSLRIKWLPFYSRIRKFKQSFVDRVIVLYISMLSWTQPVLFRIVFIFVNKKVHMRSISLYSTTAALRLPR